MNTYMTPPIFSPYFPINTCFISLKIKKVFSRLVTGLSVKVWSIRINDGYPHEMWYAQHSLPFFSSFSFVLNKSPLYLISLEYWAPHFLLHFHNFISNFFIFHSSFIFLVFFIWRGSISINTIEKGGSLHFLFDLSFHYT